MRWFIAVLASVLALAGAAVASGASNVDPPRFMDRISSVTGEHPTSGLPGFPARDYLGPGEQVVRAPFSGCVPTTNLRPWGWARTQAPALGFGGMRIYLTNTKASRQAYAAHFGFLFLRPDQCFKQGDPVGKVWWWPNDAGRSHIHIGYQAGDPLRTLIASNGRFLIQEQPPQPEQLFPPARLILEDTTWIVRVGKKVIYKGGSEKAHEYYNRQKLARTINLHFKHTFTDSPLVGFGLMFVRVARAHGIDPRLPAAIASCETSGGTKGSGPSVNNDFGLLLPGTSRHRQFDSRKEAITYLSNLLRWKYVGQGLDTIKKIGARYAPVGATNDPGNKNSRWVACVTKYYKELNGTRFL